jgi:orotate phosphoribosyltransferase
MAEKKIKSNSQRFDSKLFTMGFDEVKQRLTEIIRSKSVRHGDFVLPSGKISTRYLDLKDTTLGAEGSFLTSLATLHLLKDEVQAIGGLKEDVYSIAATSSQLAYLRGQEIDCFYVRDLAMAKRHGQSKWIEGPLKSATQVAIVHDQIIDGLSVIETIRRLQEEADAQIVQVISIVDMLDGAKYRLQDYGVDYSSVLTIEEIVGRSLV